MFKQLFQYQENRYEFFLVTKTHANNRLYLNKSLCFFLNIKYLHVNSKHRYCNLKREKFKQMPACYSFDNL